MGEYTIEQVARVIGATVEGDLGQMLLGMAPLEHAAANRLCFAESQRYHDAVAQTAAAAVIVPDDFPMVDGPVLLRVAEPRKAFLQALELFAPDRRQSGVHPSAVIAADVSVPDDAGIGPFVVIEPGVSLGAACQIRAGAFIGRNARIGAHCDVAANAVILEDTQLGDSCRLHPGVVLGSDGYGYQWTGGHHHKIPQIGNVVIDDDVEIGANSCIDRATMGETRIGAGSRLDNLVHIAHNNRIGRHVLLTAQVAIAGSSTIGDGVVAGGQVGIADHVKVGDGVHIGAQGGVIGDIDDGEKVWGTPARPMKRVMREQAAVGRLPELLRVIRRQEKELQALRDRIAALEGQAAQLPAGK